MKTKKEEKLEYIIKDIIRTRLNYRYVIPDSNKDCKNTAFSEEIYDGFDMSGGRNTRYHNMEILSRFKDIIPMHGCCIFDVMFWKGSGNIIKINEVGEEIKIVENVTGCTTVDIIFNMVKLSKRVDEE